MDMEAGGTEVFRRGNGWWSMRGRSLGRLGMTDFGCRWAWVRGIWGLLLPAFELGFAFVEEGFYAFFEVFGLDGAGLEVGFVAAGGDGIELDVLV